MTPHDKDTLLRDIFSEPLPPAFEAALLADTMRRARRKRRNRQLGKSTALLLFVSLAIASAWKLRAPKSPTHEVPTMAANPCPVISTVPLPPSAFVVTNTFPRMESIGSRTFVTTISTTDQPRPFRVIDDAQLLALAQPRQALLIRLSPDEQTLIFPADEPPAPRE